MMQEASNTRKFKFAISFLGYFCSFNFLRKIQYSKWEVQSSLGMVFLSFLTTKNKKVTTLIFPPQFFQLNPPSLFKKPIDKIVLDKKHVSGVICTQQKVA